MTRRIVGEVVVAIAVLVVFLGTDPMSGAGPLGLVDRNGRSTPVVLAGPTVIPEDEITDDVWVLTGDVTVIGRVNGDVTVARGRVDIEGHVHGDVTVLRGDVVLGRTGTIKGRLRTSTPPTIGEGARIAGGIGRLGPSDVPRRLEVLAALLGAGMAAVLLVVRSDALDRRRSSGRGTDRDLPTILALLFLGQVVAVILWGWWAVVPTGLIGGPYVATALVHRHAARRPSIFSCWAVVSTAVVVLALTIPSLVFVLVSLAVALCGSAWLLADPVVRRPSPPHAAGAVAHCGPVPDAPVRAASVSTKPAEEIGPEPLVEPDGWLRRKRRSEVARRGPSSSRTADGGAVIDLRPNAAVPWGAAWSVGESDRASHRTPDRGHDDGRRLWR